ncbi:hypothetical protein [Desulfovibrio sp. DV]|uniref:hypothetical protein n=1 Tax=Desulfovibrio sp. DV TaxID=1844708 RepID=UPI000B2311BE|nr:hypothetical protein [Desulfovibrio sp. DV]
MALRPLHHRHQQSDSMHRVSWILSCILPLVGFLALAVVLFRPLPALAVDWETSASISLSEEFNDNVNDTANAKSDLITSLKPTLKLDYAGNRTTASVAYAGSLRQYAFGNRQNEFLNTLEAKASLEAIENLLLAKVSDSNKMVFTDATLGAATEADSTSNQVNQNNLKVGLGLQPASWERTPVSLDVDYMKTTYWDGTGIDKNGQQIVLDVLHSATQLLDIGGDAKVYRQEAADTNLTRISATGVVRFTYAEDCYLYSRVGVMRSVIQGESHEIQPIWSAGLAHVFGRTSLTIDSQAGYIDNPSTIQDTYRTTITANLQRTFERSILTLNAGYVDYSGNDTLQSKQLTVGLKELYSLTPRLNFVLSGSYITNTTSIQTLDRIYGASELHYELPSDYSLSLWFRHKVSNSTTNNANTYHANMVGIGLQKTF